MRRTDEWGSIVEQLPLDRVFQIDYRLLSDRLSEIPDDANEILRLLDGRRTLAQVIAEASQDELAGASILSKLFIEKIILPVERETRIEAPASAACTGRNRQGSGGGSGEHLGGTDAWFAGPEGTEPASAPPSS